MSMVTYARKKLSRNGPLRISIVPNVGPFAPILLIVWIVQRTLELDRFSRFWIKVHGGTHPCKANSRGTETSKKSHTIELGDGPAIREKYCGYVFSLGLIK